MKTILTLFNITILLNNFKIFCSSAYLTFDFIFAHLEDPIYLMTYFGESDFPIRSPINTMMSFTQLNPLIYNPNQTLTSNHISSEPIQHQDKIYYGEKYTEIVKFGETKTPQIKNYSFYIFYNESYPLTGYGFGYKFKDDSFSFVHQLYNSHLISHKSFSFLPYGEAFHSKGKLFFGNIPENILANYKYNGECQVNNEYPFWGCYLNNIHLENGIDYQINKYSIFNSAQFYLVLSRQFFDLLYDKVFLPWVDGETCYRIDGIQRSSMKCLESVINHIGDISFEFEKFKIKIPLILFFECDEVLCNSLYSSDNINKEHFEFGTSFLKLMNATVFDYEKQTISIYNNLFEIQKINNKGNTHSNKLYILVFCNIAIIIALMLNIYIWYLKDWFYLG